MEIIQFHDQVCVEINKNNKISLAQQKQQQKT